MRLQGSKVLITGAAKRLGRAMALGMARRGADLVLHFRASADDAERTADEARSLGVTVIKVQADLSDAAGVQQLLQGARDAFGRVDVLVNNASV